MGVPKNRMYSLSEQCRSLICPIAAACVVEQPRAVERDVLRIAALELAADHAEHLVFAGLAHAELGYARAARLGRKCKPLAAPAPSVPVATAVSRMGRVTPMSGLILAPSVSCRALRYERRTVAVRKDTQCRTCNIKGSHSRSVCCCLCRAARFTCARAAARPLLLASSRSRCPRERLCAPRRRSARRAEERARQAADERARAEARQRCGRRACARRTASERRSGCGSARQGRRRACTRAARAQRAHRQAACGP